MKNSQIERAKQHLALLTVQCLGANERDAAWIKAEATELRNKILKAEAAKARKVANRE